MAACARSPSALAVPARPQHPGQARGPAPGADGDGSATLIITTGQGPPDSRPGGYLWGSAQELVLTMMEADKSQMGG